MMVLAGTLGACSSFDFFSKKDDTPPDEPAVAIIQVPPEIPRSWQFSFRTALPPRAPSFVS